MTPTESQKRDALAWADNNDQTYDCCAHNRVLAHFLRLAESELAEANHIKDTYAERIKEWEQRAHSLTRATNPQDFFRIFTDYRDSLSALRAENEALKQNTRILKSVDGIDPAATQYIDAVLKAVDRAEAAEAKVARMEQRWRQSCGDDFVERALRETEGGAK